MNLLSDIITYIRRIIKSPTDEDITDNLIIDYINRFWIMDVDARMQLFDLKTKYQFQTTPGVDQYNMPLYNPQIQPGGAVIAPFPVYQGFMGPAYVNGVPIGFETQRNVFFSGFPNIVQYQTVVETGDGGTTYSFQLPLLSNIVPIPNNPPYQGILRGHVDLTGIIAYYNSTLLNQDPPIPIDATTSLPSPNLTIPTTSIFPGLYITTIGPDGANVVVTDSGQFLTGNVNYGLLLSPGNAPVGNTALGGGYTTTSNTVNYFTGQVNVTFPVAIASGVNINAQCYYFNNGLPRSMLYYNNTITLRVPPALQYLVEVDAYLSPAAFLVSGNAIPFGYMAEYIARGAARKILSDTGDIEQFNFYEPLFREQEILVWKRSQRQFTASRTQTIYSRGHGNGFNGSYGSQTF